MVTPQIEEAIFEPDLLRILLLAEYRHRQFGGRSKDLDLVGVDLDSPGRHVRIFSAGRPPAHLAVDPHHPFRTQRLGKLEGLAVGVGDNLSEPIVVAQIDEKHPAMVADAMAPAGEPHSRADIAFAKRAAGM